MSHYTTIAKHMSHDTNIAHHMSQYIKIAQYANNKIKYTVLKDIPHEYLATNSARLPPVKQLSSS
jgi:hypothetical protein